MIKTILLAGESASGKSTLARALAFGGNWGIVSTSAHLRKLLPGGSLADLFRTGEELDIKDSSWVLNLANESPSTIKVVDAIRSWVQAYDAVDWGRVLRINVECDWSERHRRHFQRGTEAPNYRPFRFESPDFVWRSDRVSISTAVAAIHQLMDRGNVDILIGGQYGSEGKGKLAALLAPHYQWLVRSGGPNAGHWVRDENYEYCFHHIPSGAIANPEAQVAIAAGATVCPWDFLEEVRETGVGKRLHIDPNTFTITPGDIQLESDLVGMIGSTAQGVGQATIRRILRDKLLSTPVSLDESLRHWAGDHVYRKVGHALADGANVLIEGTQGSGLSVFHGPHPFTTSRDTNSAGLLSESGITPSQVRDTWMVVRSYPIRVGGNSGPMVNEVTWTDIAAKADVDSQLLRSRELTSTTKRLRRVAEFDWEQFHLACLINRPTKLFLSFADYLDPQVVHCQEWGKVSHRVRDFVGKLEGVAGVMVAGISTGRMQSQTIWRDR